MSTATRDVVPSTASVPRRHVAGMFYRAGADWSAELLTRAEELCGYSIDEINALPGKWLAVVHPDDRARVFADNAEAISLGKTHVDLYRILTRQGECRWIEDHKHYRFAADGSFLGVEGFVFDASERVRHEAQLANSEHRHRSALETSLDGYWLVDLQGRLLDVNSAYCRLSGYSRAELLKLRISDLEALESPAETAAHIERVIASGHGRFETAHRRKDGSSWRVEVNTAYWNQEGGRLFVFMRDIEAQKRAEALVEARLRLTELAISGSIDDLLQATLDTAERFTDSRIGFFHFVDSDQQTLTLQAWSTNTLAHMCKAEGRGLHYSIGDAGVWTDCVRQRAPVIHNDYAALTHKRGLPNGHAEIIREATVPVFHGALITAVIGVGNKPVNYEASDIALLSELATMTMEIVAHKRAERELQRTEANLRRAQSVAHVGSWTLDLSSLKLEWSEETYRIFGVPAGEEIDLLSFFERVAPEDRDLVRSRPRDFESGDFADIEYRVLTPQGTRWVYERAELTRDADGKPQRIVGVVQDITERKLAAAEIAQLSHYDSLTGLPNRQHFGMRLRQALGKASRRKQRTAVLQIDLDLFKNINDGFGHEVGDVLLAAVAARLRERLRDEDVLARLGGDEFAVLLEEIDTPADAAILAHGLLDALAKPFPLAAAGAVQIGASIGLTLFPDDSSDPIALLRNADAAVYLAKGQGRNTYRFYTESLTRAAQERITLESRLREAIDAGRLVLHYQPLIDARDGAVMGAEALVRWNDPNEGLIPPGRFIPVAEDSGLIAPLGAWVLHEACRQMKCWLDAGRPLRTMAVNLSPRQFALQDIIGVVEQALAGSGLPPEYLELEITEGALMEHGEAAIATLNALRQTGVRISIDDFGTGYSSLSYLKRFPIDKLKIDQSFVRDITTDQDDAAIVTAIIAMGRSLGLCVLAEGVETEEQFRFLERQDCDYYQGYLFSRAVSAECFPEHSR